MVERKERAWSLSISPRLPPTLLPVRQLKSKHLDRDGTGGNCRRPRDTCHHTSALEREPAGRVPPHIFTTPRQQMSDSSCPIHTDRECAAVVQLKDKPQAPWRVQTTTSVNWHVDKPSWWGFISCWFVIPATGPLHFFSEFARRIMTFWESRTTTISQSFSLRKWRILRMSCIIRSNLVISAYLLVFLSSIISCYFGERPTLFILIELDSRGIPIGQRMQLSESMANYRRP